MLRRRRECQKFDPALCRNKKSTVVIPCRIHETPLTETGVDAAHRSSAPFDCFDECYD